MTGEFPSQRASDAENVSIWWRHHDQTLSQGDNTFWALYISEGDIKNMNKKWCSGDQLLLWLTNIKLWKWTLLEHVCMRRHALTYLPPLCTLKLVIHLNKMQITVAFLEVQSWHVEAHEYESTTHKCVIRRSHVMSNLGMRRFGVCHLLYWEELGHHAFR